MSIGRAFTLPRGRRRRLGDSDLLRLRKALRFGCHAGPDDPESAGFENVTDAILPTLHRDRPARAAICTGAPFTQGLPSYGRCASRSAHPAPRRRWRPRRRVDRPCWAADRTASFGQACCSDQFRVMARSPEGRARDLTAQREGERVQKGGSWLCHESYCHRYRIAAGTGRSADTSAGHTGFRLAWDQAPRV